MIRIKKSFFVLVILITAFSLLPFNFVKAYVVKAPTIIQINQNYDGGAKGALLTGLTQNNTEVMIYIDGSFVGDSEVMHEATKADNFYFYLPRDLKEGRHTIAALARDKASLWLSSFSNEVELFIAPLPAPTLIEPDENTITGKVKPLIKGLVPSNTFAHIYIDGVYNGRTEAVSHNSGTANFAYQPFLNLKPGWHSAWAITENKSGQKSCVSNILNFKIEDPLPAPILKTPVVNSNTKYSRPFIVGLAKNNSLIKVFIDHKLYGQLRVENNESGTANFAYQPFLQLTNGTHLIYVIATDLRGKESQWSNIVYFDIVRLAAPAISQKAATEIYENKGIDSAELKEAEILQTKIEDKELEDRNKDGVAKDAEDIKEILQQDESKVLPDTGLVDESDKRQEKLQLNLIIFILFLIFVIIWIFWVNRELIKERRKNNKSEDKK